MSEKQSYRDADDMPTERAVLEREWKAMRLALSTPRAALAAQPGVVGEPVASVRVEGGMMRGATRRPGMASLPDGDHKLYAAAPTEAKPAQQDAVDAAYEACAQIAFDADHMGSVNMKLLKNRIGNAIRAAISAKKVGQA